MHLRAGSFQNYGVATGRDDRAVEQGYINQSERSVSDDSYGSHNQYFSKFLCTILRRQLVESPNYALS